MVPAGLTLAAFATDAYVLEGPAGQEELVFVRQAAVSLTFPTGSNTHWIAIDVSTVATRVGWTTSNGSSTDSM